MTSTRKRILAISGSTRNNSSNERILKYIGKNYNQQIELSIFDGIDKLPHFNPGLDKEPLPQTIIDFRDQIAKADGILICTPEYVFSLPGSLKNAIEWNVSTTLFSKKPLAFIIASASGEKAFESLELVMTTLESTIGENSKLLIKGAKGIINSKAEIENKNLKGQLYTLVKSLLKTIEEAG